RASGPHRGSCPPPQSRRPATGRRSANPASHSPSLPGVVRCWGLHPTSSGLDPKPLTASIISKVVDEIPNPIELLRGLSVSQLLYECSQLFPVVAISQNGLGPFESLNYLVSSLLERTAVVLK